MARHYEKPPMKSQQGKGISALWLSFVTFVFGYLAASWCDVNQLTDWVTSLAQSKSQHAPLSQTQVVSNPEHPKLEFYTLLTNEPLPAETKVDQQSPTEHAAAAPTSTAPLDLELRPPTPILSHAHAQLTPPPLPKTVSKAVEAPKLVNTYAVQVGSFRALREAQRMQERLHAQGLPAEITTVTQQASNWYRVHIGPYASLVEAQQAQQNFARREHIIGMIRKVS